MTSFSQVLAGRRRVLAGPGAAQQGEQRGHRLLRRTSRHRVEPVLHATNDVDVLLGLLAADDTSDAYP
jgi:hypothetical protein